MNLQNGCHVGHSAHNVTCSTPLKKRTAETAVRGFVLAYQARIGKEPGFAFG